MIKKNIVFLLILTMLIALGGCSKEEKKVVIASKPMTEQFIIAEMLIALIEKETDIKVEYKQGIGGGTSNIHPAMEKGEVDIYPEYTGTGWMFVLKKDLISDPKKLYEEVKKAYEKEYNIIWMGLYGFNDTFGLAIKSELADKLNLETYSDLADVSDQLRFGAGYDFYEREDGMPGLKAVYGFKFEKETELDLGLRYQAIDQDEVDVIDVYSTDAQLRKFDLKVLEDDKNFFPSYFCATLIRKETLEKYPELGDVLEILTGQISNEEMAELNYLVEVEKREPKDVAVKFLTDKGLLK